MKRMMKRTVMHMMLLAITMTVNAQSIEPNLKWGKPTDQELNMTEYAADKDADAVVLYHKTDVSYEFINNDFRVFYRVNTRLKVLKPEGRQTGEDEDGALDDQCRTPRQKPAGNEIQRTSGKGGNRH